MKEKSMTINAVLNTSRTALSILFPLITYPYAARVLGVVNIGAVHYTASIISYFILLAELGITTYAMREGSRYRDEPIKLEVFAGEVFSIGLLASIVSSLLLVFCIFLVPGLKSYTALLLVQSISVLGNCLAINWIYTIKEDYGFIALRALIVHILALVLLFVFVKTQDDYVIYAATTVIANTGANIFNFIYARRYCHIHLNHFKSFKKHLKSIFIIFGSNVTATIYGNSDKTLLGAIAGDYSVGLYGTSVNVYTALKSCISAIALSTLPRLSFYKSNKMEDDYQNMANSIFCSMLIILLPVVMGVVCVSDDIILLIAGRNYLSASLSLKILSFGLFFSLIAIFYTSVVLLPNHQELTVMKGSAISATLNIVLNLFILSTYKQNGAAFTTLLSEMFMCVYEAYKSHALIKLNIDKRLIVSSVCGCISFIPLTILINSLKLQFIIELMLSLIICASVYILFLKVFGKKSLSELLKL